MDRTRWLLFSQDIALAYFKQLTFEFNKVVWILPLLITSVYQHLLLVN